MSDPTKKAGASAPVAKPALKKSAPIDIPRKDEEKGSLGGESGAKAMAFGKHAQMPILETDMYAKVEIPELKEWDPETLRLDATVVAVGKRRTGKSFLFRELIWRQKDKFCCGCVISQTDELNHYWSKFFPKKYVYKRYDPEILQAIFRRQKKIINNKGLTDAQKDKLAPYMIVLDDVISDPKLKFSEELTELFVAGRHYRISTFITTQYTFGITPVLRANTDLCFLFRCVQHNQREALKENYADALTKVGFFNILDAYTEDNETLVVDTCPETPSLDPLDSITWYKAMDPPEKSWKFGSKEFWEGAERGRQDVGRLQTTSNPHVRPVEELLHIESVFPEWTRTTK